MTGVKTARFTITLLAAIGFALPVLASAASISAVASPSQQLLPPGSNTCAPLQVEGVVPYVYDNALDAFDVTIADPTYVSIIGSAGDTGIPLRYMRRTMNADGTLTIHVDIPSTAINGTLPVSLTLLSAPSGKPVCISVVSFTLTGPATPVKIPATPPSPYVPPAPEQNAAATTTISGATSSTGTTVSPVVSGGLQSILARACTAAGPYQLWFILLALFMVVVGLVAFAEPPLGNKGPEVPLVAILVPLVLLLAFWYFAPACRVAGWIPVVLIIAAAIGLVTAFRDQEMPRAKVIQLPSATSQTTGTSTKPLVVEKTTTTKTSVLVPQTPPLKTTTTTKTTIITPPPAQPKNK